MLEYKKPMLIVIWIVMMSVCGYLTKGKDRTTLFVTSMVYFNFPLSLAIVIAAWGWSVYTFDKHLVPYEHSRILDLGERTPGPVIMMSALYMSLAVGSSLTIYWALFAIGLHSLATAVPLFLYIGGLFYCLYSFWPSRDFLWTRVKRIIRRPTLADMFFADILTSFSKDLADLSTAVCSMLFAWGLYSTDLGAHESICGPHSWVAAALSASPSVFRLVQCTWLHFSPPTQELESRVLEVAPPPTWLSVVKQVGQLSLIFLSQMYYRSSPQVWSSYYQPAWIGVLIATSVFSIYSDLFIDWNLGMCGWMCGAPTVTTQIFTGARRWCYYGFIVLDIFFRVSWAWRFSDLGSSWIPFALSVVEIFRRVMWFPLRIEGWQVSLGIGPRGTAEAVVEVPPTGAAAMGEVELPPAL